MLIKKFVAAMAAISMLATSFVVMNVAAADSPAITASVISADDTVSGSDIGVKFTFANIEPDKLIKGFNFAISVPTELKNPKNKNITSNATLKATIQYDEENDESPFADGWDAYYNASGNYKFIWATDGSTRVSNSDWFTLEFKGAESYDELADGSFKVNVFAITQDNVTGALSLEKGQITVTDPTTSSEDPTPTPEWVEATPIGENEGRFIGDEGFDQDEAVAYYVTLDLAQADPTITWRAKFNGSDSFLGKQISSGISDKSSGEVKFGMVIDGMKGKTVSNVGAIWGAQGK